MARGWARVRGLGATVLLIPLASGAQPASTDPEAASASSAQSAPGSASLALVRGRLPGAWLLGSELVIAIDQSNSAMLASGIDVDGDGRVGRTRNWAKDQRRFHERHENWTSDSGDTILAAAVAAATRLVDELSDRGSRIGVLTFTDAVRVRAELGPASAARAALAGIRATTDFKGTNLARALTIASDMLDPDGAPASAGRRRAILVFSDGKPTAPDGEHWASRRALALARDLGERGVAVYTVALGEESDPGYLAELASAAGGGLLAPEDLLALASSRVAPEGLVIENLTLHSLARSVRAHADGSFDGIVPLARGENLLEIRAALADGRQWSERRVVRHEAPDPAEQSDPPGAESRLLELRDRLREAPPP